MVITADVKNVAAFDPSCHEGVFSLNNRRTSANQIATAVLELIDRHGMAEHMNGKIENLDEWLDG